MELTNESNRYQNKNGSIGHLIVCLVIAACTVALFNGMVIRCLLRLNWIHCLFMEFLFLLQYSP